jgi:AmmeMemoRadiSam system protein B/AmmeMemoRadiSam system protein A
VAGLFYPGDESTLARDVRLFLQTAVSPAPTLLPNSSPKAIIVPHAGYVYSGSVAAAAYARIAALKGTISRVVLLGPCHRVAVTGVAIPSASVTHFATPLGEIALDRTALDALRDLAQIVSSDAAHAQEHSLEVQLPFLQACLGDFQLVPLAVGRAGVDDIAQILDRLWGGPETLIVISSDLSHFHNYVEANQIDRASVAQIASLQPLTSFDQACGALPINGMIDVARRREMTIELLDQRNSGDTAGDKSRVVGYAAFALYEAAPDSVDAADDKLGRALLVRARNAIGAHFQHVPQAEPAHPALAAPGATFVTLTQNGALRGCIGSLEAHRSLEQDVRANALAAALRDPRFPPLTAAELSQTRVEVSLLTAPQALHFKDEAHALRQLRPMIDGVIFVAGNTRSTFLPQVWEQLPDVHQFMAHLKQKAGLPASYWSPAVTLFVYQVQKWKEPEQRTASN